MNWHRKRLGDAVVSLPRLYRIGLDKGSEDGYWISVRFEGPLQWDVHEGTPCHIPHITKGVLL